MAGFSVYFATITSKKMQKTFAIQNKSITLLTMIISDYCL